MQAAHLANIERFFDNNNLQHNWKYMAVRYFNWSLWIR